MTALKNRLPILTLILILSGCASTLSDKESADDAIAEWREKAKSSRAHSPAPSLGNLSMKQPTAGNPTQPALPLHSKISKRSAPPTEKPRRLPKEKVTMQLRNTDISVILAALAKMVKQNVMMNESVTGIVNINVHDMPWDQVFEGALKTVGLTYRWEGDIIRVMTREDLEHDNDIDAILHRKRFQSLEKKQVEPLITSIFHINYADANNLQMTLEKFLTLDKENKPRGSVSVDEHNQALVVKAIPEDVAKMEMLVAALDRPTQQILIEAHIIETNRDTAQELGMQIGGVNYNAAGDNNWDINFANPMNGGVGLLDPATANTGFGSNYPAKLPGAGLIVGAVSGDIGGFMLQAQLSAMEQESKLNILSSPSITTLDNQTASVASGNEVPFQTIDVRGNIEIVFKEAVLKLEVTPHVIDGKTLKLKILITKDELDFTNPVNGYPTIIKKEAETTVVLFDSQTTVIGGLTKEKTERTKAGTPGLSDLPLIGGLFGKRGSSTEMNEIMIFITPHILKPKIPGMNF